MLKSSLLPLFLLLSLLSYSQIEINNIDIIRDSFGVPHIFAPTDEEVAYGLAWATAEDDFKTIQEQLLPIKGLAGQVSGKNGAMFDVAVHILNPNEIVNEQYDTALSPKFRGVLESYVKGINRYAELHPDEVLHKKLFPASPKDVLKAYVLGMALLSHADKPIFKILGGDALSMGINETRGSNAFAINSKKSLDGNTYMAINSHQPLEGLNSWYEAHLCSEEGWNIVGSNFVGGVSIFHGTNENISWAHTVNHADFADVYKLEMHPEKKLHYKYNGEWIKLEPYHTKAKIKLLGFIPFSLKQKFYKSVFGTTFLTDEGVFSIRITANQSIKTAEQWYQMNKAKNYTDFREALELQGITCTNIVYADKYDNIFYISNGLLPKRKEKLDWTKIVVGKDSSVLWNEFYPIDSLPQVLNPIEGYVYNCNHSPFLSSDLASNPSETATPESMGYQSSDILTNRGERFYTLINNYDKVSYEQFKAIRADRYFEKPMDSAPNLEPLFNLNPEKYTQHKSSIQKLHLWDRNFSESSTEASLVILVINHLFSNGISNEDLRGGNKLTESKLIESLAYAEKHLLKSFGTLKVPLNKLQIHSRGDKFLPFAGGPDVMAAVYSTLNEDGTMRPIAGDSYIQMVQWTDQGPIIESINAYGASNHAESPHHTDQMDLFTNQKFKPMTLDKDVVYKQAKSIYHPK
jgi:acyl-homoserine-lactone acylase